MNDDGKYLVLAGNEIDVGFGKDNEKFIIGLENAEKEFDRIVEACGCAVIYEIKKDRLTFVKYYADFDDAGTEEEEEEGHETYTEI